MTETTTATLPPDASEQTTEAATDPTDILMYVIVGLLAPIFLCGCDDVYFARLAAWKTVAQYQPRNHIHLIAIAQIIACGLAGVGSIGLAFTEDLSLSMSLRLRTNAAALFRAAEQARRVLREGSPPARAVRPVESQPEPEFIPNPNQEEYEAALIAAIADTQRRAAETLARIDPGYTPPAPAQAAVPPVAITTITTAPAKTDPAPTTTAAAPLSTTSSVPATQQMVDAEWQARWASKMTKVAQEFTDNLKNRSSAERAMLIQRSGAPDRVATTRLAGKGEPDLNPGDLDANLPTSIPGT
jgi:hypothetical protein